MGGEPGGEAGRRDGGESRSAEDDRRRVVKDLSDVAAGVDAGRVPEALCLACARLLPISGASVSISASRMLRTTLCASDTTAARLAEAQYTLGEGPCQSAFEVAVPVLASDLTQGPDTRRWPVFAQQALQLGVRAAFSLPLGVGAEPVGTLDLYCETSGGLSDRDLRIALMVRDAITFAVLNLESATAARPGEDPDEVAAWIAAAEADHTEVHQAIGMVMVQLDVDPQQALDRMRGRAFTEGRTVSEVAEDVVARRLRFRPDTGPGQGPDAEPGRRPDT
ncbi:GAF and ANTAR domain-containing protein [Streptomyces aureus]|uniref:GAF and ANTAR domain-containing protein n=1 Tax=Streptomyces aureus TaxID=193461 RepID=UPI00369865CB